MPYNPSTTFVSSDAPAIQQSFQQQAPRHKPLVNRKRKSKVPEDSNSLRKQLAVLEKSPLLKEIELERYATLFQHLLRNVKHSRTVHSLSFREDLEPAELAQYKLLELSFESAILILQVLNITSIGESLCELIDDEMVELMSAFKSQFRENILGHLDPSFRSKQNNKKKQKVSNTKSAKVTTTKFKKRGHNYFLFSCNKAAEMFDGLAALLRHYTPPETFAMLLADTTLPCLYMAGITSVQLSAIGALCLVFVHYPKHREDILEQTLGFLPKTLQLKKNLRTFKLQRNNQSIQVMTAFFLLLVQSVSHLPSTSKDAVLPLKHCQEYSSAIISHYIDKCAAKTEDNEYKTLLDHFIQDLLLLANNAEWPAANMMLHIVCWVLCRVLGDNNNTKTNNAAGKGEAANPALKLLAIDVLGTIITRIKQEVNMADEELMTLPVYLSSLTTTAVYAQEPVSNDAPAIDLPEAQVTQVISLPRRQSTPVCQCGKYKIGSFIVKCSTCSVAHHDLCASDHSITDQQGQWICISCRVAEQITSSAPAAKSIADQKREPDTPTDCDTMVQLVLNHINSRASSEPWLITSRQFLIATWLDNEWLSSRLSQSNKQYMMAQWSDSNDDPSRFSSARCHVLSVDIATRIYRQLSIHIKGSIFHIVNELLHSLLSVLYDPSKISRAKAMKSFAAIVEVDPTVLADEFVHKSIKNSFNDDSIAVREHTVDLIGKYILLKPELTETYIDAIAERIADKGISVRKRVVKTLHDVCLSQVQHPLVPQLCRILVGRINDEDSIKELVIKTFKDLWFTHDENNSVPMKTRQIVEVVKQLNQDTWFINLIKNLIDGRSGSTKSLKKQTAAQSAKQLKSASALAEMCQAIVATLVDMLISYDEKRRTKDFAGFLAIFKCLRIFCKVDPTYMVAYVKLLHPYIKMTAKSTIGADELKIYIIVTFILQKAVPLVEHPDTTFLGALETDLLGLIASQGSQLVHSSIKCLCAIVEHASHNYALLESQLCRQVHLLQFCGGIPKGEILRGLYTVGLLVRYYDFEKRDFKGVIDTIVPIIAKLYNFAKAPQDVVSKSLEAIGNIIISSPPILNTHAIRDIVAKALASPEVKSREIILSIYLKLLKRESKSIRDGPKAADPAAKTDEEADQSDEENEESEDSDSNKKKTTKKTKKKTAAEKKTPIISMNIDIKGESLVSSIQKFFGAICKLLVDTETNVRMNAISTVELIVHQGIINPLEAVPEIITLVTDSNLEIAEIAYRALVHINEKHSATLFKRVVESLKLCFKFHTSLGTKSPYNLISKGLGRFYQLFRHVKVSRTTFIAHIMSQFDTSKTYSYKTLDYFRFTAEMLASMPYGNMDELFGIIVAIDKLVSLKGGSILEDVHHVFGKKRASMSEGVMTGHLVTCAVLTLLVELKHYIIKVYGITKERATLYLADEGKANADKLALTLPESIVFNKSNYPFSDLIVEEELRNEETQKKVFLDFKSLMKNDNVDYSTICGEKAKKTKSTNTTGSKRKSTK
eukprot:gene1113-1271_t